MEETRQTTGYEVPQRIDRFVDDFMASVPACVGSQCFAVDVSLQHFPAAIMQLRLNVDLISVLDRHVPCHIHISVNTV